jgi:ABC-2 type transport system ATP-binding protein
VSYWGFDMSEVSLQSVTKQVKSKSIMDEVSLEVDPGELALVIGPNSSGKSILLHIVNGLIKPTSGVVRVADMDPFREWRKLLKTMGYVPQRRSYCRIGHLSVRDFLRRSASIHGLRETRNMIQAMVELFELADILREPIGRVSNGERIRTTFAGELIHDPRILALDEPFEGLDSKWQKIILGVIRELKSMDKTIIVASVSGDQLVDILDKRLEM